MELRPWNLYATDVIGPRFGPMKFDCNCSILSLYLIYIIDNRKMYHLVLQIQLNRDVFCQHIIIHAFSVVQVANTKKETVFKWYKDGSGLEVEALPDLQKGVCQLAIPRVWYNPLTVSA